MPGRRDHLERADWVAWLEKPIGFPVDLDKVALDRCLRLSLEQGLVPSQDASIALPDGNLDTGEAQTDAGHTAHVVTVGVRQHDPAELLPNLFDNQGDLVCRLLLEKKNTTHAIIRLLHAPVHRETARLPGHDWTGTAQ